MFKNNALNVTKTQKRVDVLLSTITQSLINQLKRLT